MKLFKQLAMASAVATAFVAASPAVAQTAGLVRIDGSSTVFPVSEAVAEEFQKSTRGATKVTVGVSGTGGGFRRFCRGETDISNASRPILRSEIEDCAKNGIRFVELPIAYDALTVVVNPKNTFLASITIEELRRMWEPAAQGKVTRWNQVNPAWPDAPLRLFGPGADSGTFDYFTEAVNGKAKASRGDFTASEDDNVLVQGISRDVNALGFFGFAYFAENRERLKGVPISWKGGKPVAPAAENVVNGSYTPLSRPIFIYVSEAALKRPEVRQFVEFYNKVGPKLVSQVKYVPLPAIAYQYNLDAIAKMRLGTKFGGENRVGLSIEELMKIEAKQ